MKPRSAITFNISPRLRFKMGKRMLQVERKKGVSLTTTSYLIMLITQDLRK